MWLILVFLIPLASILVTILVMMQMNMADITTCTPPSPDAFYPCVFCDVVDVFCNEVVQCFHLLIVHP